MKLSLRELKNLVNEEMQIFSLHEKRKKTRNEQAAVSEEVKEGVAAALDILEESADESEDPDELRWYLTKIGEMFGMEPIDDDED
jgi:uncharacterized protein YpuA (DUF1002 family)